jgi:hypothetical protein
MEVEAPLHEELLEEGAMQRLRDFWAEYGLYVGIASLVLAVVAIYLAIAPTRGWPVP